jgi:hypothetical protein
MSVITASKRLRLLQKNNQKSLFYHFYFLFFYLNLFFKNACYFFIFIFCQSYPGLLYVVMLFLEIYSV